MGSENSARFRIRPVGLVQQARPVPEAAFEERIVSLTDGNFVYVSVNAHCELFPAPEV
jgi:hypothetical protein